MFDRADPLHATPSIESTVTLKEALAKHRAGRLDEAAQRYRQILWAEPGHADALHLLGMVAYQRGDLEQALALIRSAIAIYPAAPSYYSNLGNVLRAQEKIAEAETCYRRSLDIHPNQAEVHLNLGNVLKALGNVDAALASYQSARFLNPELAEAEVAESTTLLLQGEFNAGWGGLEARWRTRDYGGRPRNDPQPQWGGEQLLSGRLLVWGEQGIGDEVMFAGLLHDVLAGGTRCLIECDPRLQPLFARSFPEVEVLSRHRPDVQKELDLTAQIPCGSLPGLFRQGPKDFSATQSPYLVADKAKRTELRDRYYDGRPLVGIAWHTNNKQSGRSRSIPLAALASLFAKSGVRWVSLQYGDPTVLRDEAKSARAPLLIDGELDQWADLDGFAAQIAAMDLVVTIDNSTAHIAAALGRPTWTLLPFAPDWRWMLKRDDSPWYPTMRLFRQGEPGQWNPVLDQVKVALASYRFAS